MLTSLENKVAVVTGGGGALGRAVAERLVAEGARVALVDQDRRTVESAAVGLGDRSLPIVADVTTEDGTHAWVGSVLEQFGRIDLLHNNAGIEGPVAPITSYGVEAFDRVMAVNVRGSFLTLQAVLRQMIGQGEGGAVVNMSSLAALTATKNLGAYAMSKRAVIALTKCAAVEVAGHGIRVNALCPGPVQSPMMGRIESGRSADAVRVRAAFVAAIPMARYAKVEEVASAVFWLLSPESAYVSGTALALDGGVAAG